jgi:hypothetical protein
MSNILPLLRPCPNNLHKVGQNQETFVLNPCCEKSSTQLEMLAFLGKLMGCAARAKNYMDLYLSPIIWKLIVRQRVTREDLRDIDEINANQIAGYREMGRLENYSNDTKALAAARAVMSELTYTTMNKGGETVELHLGGASVSWIHESIALYRFR